MARPIRTDDGMREQSHVHCPNCDTKFFSATEVVDLNYKCIKCHRHYLINIKEGSVTVFLTYAPKEKDANV